MQKKINEIKIQKKFGIVFLLTSVCVLLLSCASKQVGNGHVSDTQTMMKRRVAMFDALTKEIDRVDADRKDILKLKDENWEHNMNEVRIEVEKAKTPQEFGRALKKVDALYPHVQSQLVLNPDIESVPLGSKIVLPFKMMPTITDKNDTHFKFFISQVSADDFEPGPVPHIGDEVLEINKKGIEDWEQENYTFCKSASHLTCALELNHNFRNETLSWHHEEMIEMKILSGADKVIVRIKPKIEVSSGIEPSENSDVYNDMFPCGIDIKRRYFQFGFLYKGRRLCLLGSHAHPGIAVMRISNFNYSGNDDSIHSIKQEVELFKTTYWDEHQKEIKHLIIDLIDNDGGDAPISYEALLFDRPFKGQFVKYKKLKEWGDRPADETLFAIEGDGGKSIWLKSLKEEGGYAKKNWGEFFDPIPRYCVNSKLDCRVGKFEVAEQHFRGDVKVMLNQNCILGCSSFASDLAENLGARVSFYGLPDSGDPTASQMAVNLFLTPGTAKDFGFKTQVWNSAAPPIAQDLLLTQTIAFTAATDVAGNVTSGVSRKIKKMPPLDYRNYPMDYPGEILKLILNEIKAGH